MTARSKAIWTIAFAAIVALAIPWFMWGDATMVAGLPAWLWWHVGWLALTSVAFALFASRDWGLFVEVGQ